MIRGIVVKPTKALISTAYHEAGHAVVAYIERIKIRKATIVPGKDYLGVVTRQMIEKHVRDAFEFAGITPAKRARVESFIMLSLAGGIAERKHRGRANHIGSRADYETAAGLAMDATGSGEEATAYFRWLYIRTEQIIDAYWYLVEAVAEALLAKQTLTTADVEQIVHDTPIPKRKE